MGLEPEGYGGDFATTEPGDSLRHDIARVIPALRPLPPPQLIDRIGGRLTRDGWISRSNPLSRHPVAAGAGGNVADDIASMPDRGCRAGLTDTLRCRQGSIVESHVASAVGVQTPCDRAHDVVMPGIRGIVLHLLLQVTGIQTRQAGNADPVALPLESVTAEAGIGRPARAAAQGDQFPGLGQGGIRPARGQLTGRHRGECQGHSKHRKGAALET